MRCVIAGSRDFTNQRIVDAAMEACGFASEVTEVVCGMARGVDMLGLAWAKRNDVWVARYPAKWGIFRNRAGLIRNEEMAQNADALVAIPGAGPGTRHMISMAQKYDLKIFVFEWTEALAIFGAA